MWQQNLQEAGRKPMHGRFEQCVDAISSSMKTSQQLVRTWFLLRAKGSSQDRNRSVSGVTGQGIEHIAIIFDCNA